MSEEKTYMVLKEAMDIVEKLKYLYPDKFWKVDPKEVGVVAIENKTRPEKSKILSKIIGVRQPISIFCNKKYIIELYYSDWVNFTESQKAVLIAKELYHIHEESDGKMEDFDLKDFTDLVKAFGVDYFKSHDLPNLLDGKVNW